MTRRIASIGAVALLHVAIVMALLHAIVTTPLERRALPQHETIIPLMLPQMGQASRAPHRGIERRGLTAVPDITQGPFVSPMPQGTGLGTALFGCRPENLSTLSRKEQEKCTRQTGFGYAAFADAPLKFPPHVDKISPLEAEARIRNAVDPCMAAKLTGTECIHKIIFGTGLP